MSTHVDLIAEMTQQFRPLLDSSPDGVYLWVDEETKVCNENLARMFGYTIDEWRGTQPFLDNFVAPDDRELYSWNYHRCVAQLAFPVTFRFRGQRKDGSTFAAETDMIPISWGGHPVAYHFVRRLG
ncbi:MAG TPA: PAS domain-containing protein [Dehalococcoidia bacterium]|nr:PAS domain-containing protein [Dehalococcoidia bacterium]